MDALFGAFFVELKKVSEEGFRVERTGRFSIAMFEAVFRAACADAFKNKTLEVWPLSDGSLAALKNDKKFIEATKEGIGSATHVANRYKRARELLSAKSAE